MKRGTLWLVMSCSITAALLLVSCSTVVTEEAEAIAPPQEEKVVTGEEVAQPEEAEESLTPAQSPASVPETSTPTINDHSNVDRDDTNIDNSNSNLPSDGFIIERTRSDLNRAVREYKEEYTEPIIDTHIHLDPPSSGYIDESSLKDIVKSIDSAGVDSIIVMPVPNEEMPERFMVGSDMKFGRAPTQEYDARIKTIRKILGSINPDAAELIAYKNAERIFK